MKYLRVSFIFATLFMLSSTARSEFLAAAGKVDITPNLARERTYLAGYSLIGRKAQGIHDPLYAHILIVSDKKKTVALVSLDLIGFFRNQVQQLRKLSQFDANNRFLFVASIHTHSGPDTLGLWGPWPGVSGVDPQYLNRIENSIAKKIRDLSKKLKPARLSGFEKNLSPRGLCRDTRDPMVIDPTVAALRFSNLKGQTIATLVRWSCHPVTLGWKNRLLSADYPGELCRRIEQTQGGTCLFMNGAIGGHLNPDISKQGFSPLKRIGKTLADFALKNIKTAPDLPISRVNFKNETILVPIENSRYLLFLHSLAFGHKFFLKNGQPLNQSPYLIALKHALGLLKPSEMPWIKSEVSLIQIGPVTLLGIPGEIFPELVIGGYHGRYRFGYPLIQSDNPNPPDLSKAPKGPYLWDKIPGKIKIVVGLANDELGYIVPKYDFKINHDLIMSPMPKGDHYEETNSIGPSVTAIILNATNALLPR